MLMLSVECGQRVFLFTPLIIATSHRVQTVDILPSQSDWCRHDALHNTRNIIHLPAWGRVLFILYNSLPLPFRFGAVWAIGGLCVSRGLSQETISAVCYPIMRTKDQHSHQITPALSVEAENKTPARLPAWLDWSENLAHPTSNQLQTRLKLEQKHQKCFKISSSEWLKFNEIRGIQQISSKILLFIRSDL